MLECLDGQPDFHLFSFENESVILKVTHFASQRNRPDIYITYIFIAYIPYTYASFTCSDIRTRNPLLTFLYESKIRFFVNDFVKSVFRFFPQ